MFVFFIFYWALTTLYQKSAWYRIIHLLTIYKVQAFEFISGVINVWWPFINGNPTTRWGKKSCYNSAGATRRSVTCMSYIILSRNTRDQRDKVSRNILSFTTYKKYSGLAFNTHRISCKTDRIIRDTYGSFCRLLSLYSCNLVKNETKPRDFETAFPIFFRLVTVYWFI